MNKTVKRNVYIEMSLTNMIKTNMSKIFFFLSNGISLFIYDLESPCRLAIIRRYNGILINDKGYRKYFTNIIAITTIVAVWKIWSYNHAQNYL